MTYYDPHMPTWLQLTSLFYWGWQDIWQCRGDELLEVSLLDCAVVFHKFLEHNSAYHWCGHLAQWTHQHHGSKVVFEYAEHLPVCWTSWKMHFVVIFKMFVFWSIHSNHFSLHFLVHSDHSSAKQPKMIQKWSQKWLLWTTPILHQGNTLILSYLGTILVNDNQLLDTDSTVALANNWAIEQI